MQSFDEWLWSRERDLDQHTVTEEHRAELRALARKISLWHFIEFVGPSRAFLPAAVARSFEWLTDLYDYGRRELESSWGGKTYPPGWLGHVSHLYESGTGKIWVSLHVGGAHGSAGSLRVQLGTQTTPWNSLRPMRQDLQRFDLPQPRSRLPKESEAGFEQKIVHAIDESSELLRMLMARTNSFG